MKKKINKIKRFLYVFTALIIGFSFTYMLAKISQKSYGPLETMFDNTTILVDKIDHSITLKSRKKNRENKLSWLNTFQENKKKLINPEYILLGASDDSYKESYENIFNLEDSLETTFPIIHIYTAWGSKQEQKFPMTEVNAIHELGSVPMITWEPWINDFDVKTFPPFDMKKSMLSIAKGTYDTYIKEWATKAKKYGHPLYLRLGHEMNDPSRYPWGPKQNKPSEFIAAWRHIHALFHAVGADNVIWVWSPHLSYPHLNAYYPGDDQVDIVATTILNYGTAISWSQWWTFDELFGNHYQEISQFKKPVMIAELGSLNEGGNRAQWFTDTFKNLPNKYPAVSHIIFFHYSGDNTVTEDKTVNWYIKDDKEVTSSIRKEFKNILVKTKM